MSNERIDLTQFEGHTKGNWCIDDGNLMIKTDELWIRLSEAYCDDGTTEDEDAINKKLMVSLDLSQDVSKSTDMDAEIIFNKTIKVRI